MMIWHQSISRGNVIITAAVWCDDVIEVYQFDSELTPSINTQSHTYSGRHHTTTHTVCLSVCHKWVACIAEDS